MMTMRGGQGIADNYFGLGDEEDERIRAYWGIGHDIGDLAMWKVRQAGIAMREAAFRSYVEDTRRLWNV